MPRRSVLVALLTGVAVLLAACGGGDTDQAPTDEPTHRAPSADPGVDAGADIDAGDDAGDPPDLAEDGTAPAARAAEVGADELGQVPVLMYHRLLEDGGGDYDLTPEQFETELRRLHRDGYVPITTAELVDGHIDIPAGTSPVVLTFDDSTREQFALTDDGEVAPDTAVGIMLALEEELDGFRATGSFYVLGSLFGASEEPGGRLLAHLADLGFEIGNHTRDHDHLGQLDDDGVQRAIADGVVNITDAVPGADVRTLSYPFGARPDDLDLVREGSSGGVTYQLEAGLLVGSGPAPSPHDATFEPFAIPRIRSQPEPVDGDPDFGSGYWLDLLDAEPERRYVSDGDPATVAVPAHREDDLDPSVRDRAVTY